MRLPDLDKILSAMLHTHPGISDLNFSVGHPLQVETFGELKTALIDPPIENLTPYQTEQIALALMQGDRRLMYDYLSGGSCDLSYSLSDEARFRVNIFRQRGNFAIVLRRLEATVPTLETLHLPVIFREIAKEKTGLVLVTGATGSGKTTTLAAMLNEINETKAVHIVTLEDPIEFVHPCLKETFNQRELGQDFNTYANGLRAALRQAPKVGGGRQLLMEIMGNNLRTKEAVALGETEHRNFYEIIEASSQLGWMTFDQCILNAFQNDSISGETAGLYASRKGTVARGIDLIQKTRGAKSELESGLRMDIPTNAFV